MLLAACAELKDELPGAAEKWSDVMKWSQASTEDLYEENGDSRLQEQPVSSLWCTLFCPKGCTESLHVYNPLAITI